MAANAGKQELVGSKPDIEEVALDETNSQRPSEGPSVVSWDPALQLGLGLGSDQFLESAKPQSSIASHSSVINDHGDARHLSENRGPSTVRSNSEYESSTADLVAHLGAGFANPEEPLKLNEYQISSQGEHLPLNDVAGENLQSTQSSVEDGNLGRSIRAALLRSAVREGKDFLPINDLDRIVTRKSVRQELTNLGRAVSPGQLDELTDRIWEIKSPSLSKSSSKKTTRRRIFAILALMQKVGYIVEFIKEGIYDSDLPFILSEGSHKGLRQLARKGEEGTLHPIQLFSKWQIFEQEYFDTFQWQVLAPYFVLSTKKDPKILHYNLENMTIMPFVEDHEVKHTGGFGDVWRVKIHPAHHNHCDDSAGPNDNPSYAVKRLRHNNDEAFDAEVSNLKRFSASDHLHLIKLLVTFKWREQYYLLFPWADGNLQDFWQLYPNTSDLKREYHLTLWFARQCLGIAEGLKMIHTLDKPDMEDSYPRGAHQIHGRHGDLKPENILWFKAYHDKDPLMGVLKISDFGLTRFHGTLSKSHINAEGVGVTGTYRAPEYDIYKVVSQSYDIWTLGCVVLEFVTWYLLGWEGVDRFSKNRATEHVSEFVKEDVFFNFVNMKDDHGRTQTGARAKLSVANEFQNLYHHDDCSDFLLDLLEFIETRLLRMSPKNRAECDEVVEKFTELYQRCSVDRQYCTRKRQRAPTRSRTDLSLLSPAPLDLTPKMDNRINKNSLPLYTGRVEADSGPTDPQPYDTNLAITSTQGFVFPERMQQEPDRIYASPDSQRTTPATSTIDLSHPLGNPLTPSSSNEVEPRISRPQSPLRRVHFQHGRTQDRPVSIQGSIREQEEEGQTETLEGPVIPPSPILPDNFMPRPPLPPHSQSKTAKLSNSLEGGPDSSITSALTDSTISDHKSPTDETPLVGAALGGDARTRDLPEKEKPSLENQNEMENDDKLGREDNEGSSAENPSSVGPPTTHSSGTNGQSTMAKEEGAVSSNNTKTKKQPSRLKRILRPFCCVGKVD